MGALAVEEAREKSLDEETNVGVLSKLLLSQKLTELPERYLQKSPEPLLPFDNYADVPVVDLSLLKSDPEQVLKEIGEAATKSNDTCNEFTKLLTQLCIQMDELLSIRVGVSKDYFSKHFTTKSSLGVGWNHYPPNPWADRVLGAAEHLDPTSLTILWQDSVGGLPIKHEGEWIGIRPIEGAFVINVGDVMQAWSNDKFESVMHRVAVNSETPRLSMTLFASPDKDTIISASGPRKYKSFTPADYSVSMNHATDKFNLSRSRLQAMKISWSTSPRQHSMQTASADWHIPN